MEKYCKLLFEAKLYSKMENIPIFQLENYWKETRKC